MSVYIYKSYTNPTVLPWRVTNARFQSINNARSDHSKNNKKFVKFPINRISLEFYSSLCGRDKRSLLSDKRFQTK